MTFTEKFAKISKKLEKADVSKYTENFAVQVTMDDEDCGGTFFAAYIDGAYTVQPYDYFDNTANINIMAATLEKLIDKKLTVDEAVASDVIAVNGNANHIVMLFDGFEKKAPAKKVPAKKPAPKAEKKVEKKAEKKAEPKKAPAKKPAAKKEEVKAEIKPEVKKTEVKPEPKPVAKKEEPKPVVKKEVKKEEVKAEVKKPEVKKAKK